MAGKRAPGMPEEFCLVVKKTAQYCVERGTGRRITLREAMDILNQLDKYGLVHIVYNEKHVNRLVSSSDMSCLIFKFVPDTFREMIAPSRFESVVALEKCLGNECKKCTGICLFEAAKMKYYPEIGEERAYIDTEKCMGCGNCVIQCPIGALKMKVVRPPEFIPDEYAGPF